MAENLEQRIGLGTASQAEIDQGLRKHMLGIYNYMTSGVLLTGIIAMLFAEAVMTNPSLAQTVYGTPLRWVVLFSPFVMVMVMSFGMNKLSTTALQACF